MPAHKVATYLNGLKICLVGSINRVANKQNLLLFAIITLFLVLKWGYLGLVFTTIFLIPGLAILQYVGSALSDEAKLALSFPVSLMLTSGLMFSLHRAGLDLPVDWFAIIPIAAIVALALNRQNFELKLGGKEQIIAILVFLLFLNVFYSSLQKDAVPATDGSNHLYKTWVTLEGIEKYGKILEWSKYMYSGHTLFVFYPPLAYVSPAMLTHFAGAPVHKAFNFFAFWAVLYASLGVYLLAKKVGINELLSWGAAIILITTPNLLGKVFFQGNYAIVLAFSFFAIIVFLALELKGKNMLWLSFPIAAVLMLHSLIFYYAAYLIIFLALWLFFVKKEKPEGKLVIASLIIAALLSSSWLLPFIANFGQMHVAERPFQVSVPEFINHITFAPKDVADCSANSLQCVQSFTQIYLLLFILGAAGLVISRDRNLLLVMLCLILVLAIIFSEITPLVKLLPLREKMMGVGYRTYFFILPFFAVVCAFGFELFCRNRDKKAKYAAALVMLLAIYAATNFWIPAPDAWMTEMTSIKGFEGDHAVIFDKLKTLGEGRVAIFGTYGPAINPAIAMLANRALFAGWGYESAGDIANTVYKIQDRDFNLGPESSPENNLAIYRATNTNHVLVFFGNTIGVEAYNKTIFPILENYTMTWSSGNVAIFSIVPQSNFAEFVTSGSKVEYQRGMDAIFLKLEKEGELVVKESYFPNWQAYLNGKKLFVEKTDLGYLRLNPKMPGQLVLKYEPSKVDIFGGVFAFIAILGLLMAVLRGGGKLSETHTHYSIYNGVNLYIQLADSCRNRHFFMWESDNGQ